jgi:hypothetical protein
LIYSAYIEAFSHHQSLWKKEIFSIKINPDRERDVQWIKIKFMKLQYGQLIFIDERKQTFKIDLPNIDSKYSPNHPQKNIENEHNEKLSIEKAIQMARNYTKIKNLKVKNAYIDNTSYHIRSGLLSFWKIEWKIRGFAKDNVITIKIYDDGRIKH